MRKTYRKLTLRLDTSNKSHMEIWEYLKKEKEKGISYGDAISNLLNRNEAGIPQTGITEDGLMEKLKKMMVEVLEKYSVMSVTNNNSFEEKINSAKEEPSEEMMAFAFGLDDEEE